MDKLLAVIEREFLERVRTRWFVLSTLFGPLFFALLTVGPPWLALRSARSVDVSRLVVADASGTELGQMLASELGGGEGSSATTPRVLKIDAARMKTVVDSLRSELQNDRLPGVAVIDSQSPGTGQIGLLLAGNAPLGLSTRVQNAAERAVLNWRVTSSGIDQFQAEALAHLKVGLKIERILRDGRSGSAQVNIIFGGGVAVLLYVVIVLYGQIVLRSVTEEKQSRVAELVLASVPPRVLLSGKVLGIGGVALLQLGVWTTSIVALLANRERLLSVLGVSGASMSLPTIGFAELVPLFAYFLLGYVMYAALFASVGSIVSSEQEAQQAQTPVLMLLVGSVALLQPALQDPDGPIARVMSLVPFSSPIMMPLRLGMASVPTLQLVTSLALLSLSAMVAMLLAGRLYRTALLMYGKRPSLREIVRWIRVNE